MKNRKFFRRVTASLLLLSVGFTSGSNVYGAEGSSHAARVVELTGSAAVFGPTGRRDIKPLDWLERGEVVRTGKDSFVKLFLADKSVVDLGAWTSLEVKEASASNEVDLGLQSGRMKAVVSHRVDGKRSFSVRTKTTTMGVRGTQFIISVVDGDRTKARTEYYCLSGSIEVKSQTENFKTLLQKGFVMAVPDGALQKRDIARANTVAQDGLPKPERISNAVLERVERKDFLTSAPAPAGAANGALEFPTSGPNSAAPQGGGGPMPAAYVAGTNPQPESAKNSTGTPQLNEAARPTAEVFQASGAVNKEFALPAAGNNYSNGVSTTTQAANNPPSGVDPSKKGINAASVQNPGSTTTGGPGSPGQGGLVSGGLDPAGGPKPGAGRDISGGAGSFNPTGGPGGLGPNPTTGFGDPVNNPKPVILNNPPPAQNPTGTAASQPKTTAN